MADRKAIIIKFRGSCYRIIRQMKKEFRLLFTDKFNMLIAIVVPPLVILLFGFMLNGIPDEIQPIDCVVISYDSNVYIDETTLNESVRDDFALPYVNAANESDYLNLVHFYNATEEIYAMETARMMLLSSEIKVIISLPVAFSEFIKLGLPGLIDCVPDASDIKTIQDTLNSVFDSVKIFVNENNLTTYTLILILQIILLIICCLICRLYLAGSLLDLFIALFIIGFTGLSMGIFISTQSKTKTEANQLFFAVFILVLLLSGIFIPIDAMPVYLQVIAYILPLSHGDPMIRGIITKGKSVFGFDFFALLILSFVLVLISFIIFKRRKYEV
ncbi:MAG: ABC transporter permease [Candidatus Lokiarchaeota archaeon]